MLEIYTKGDKLYLDEDCTDRVYWNEFNSDAQKKLSKISCFDKTTSLSYRLEVKNAKEIEILTTKDAFISSLLEDVGEDALRELQLIEIVERLNNKNSTIVFIK